MNGWKIAGFLAMGLWTSQAGAGQPPELPSAAKKLTGTEIIELYSGKTLDFENFTKDKSLVGTANFDFSEKTMGGMYDYGNGQDKGNWSGVVRIKGDLLCVKSRGEKETCHSVYKDEKMIYETNKKGMVTSTHKL